MIPAFTLRERCALCRGSILTHRMSLVATPPANSFSTHWRNLGPVPLDLVQCLNCCHVQLGTIIDPKELFSDYVYVSGTSPSFVKHFRRMAEDLYHELKLGPKSVIIDVGSNDGTLLRQFMDLGCSLTVMGIEPARKISSQARANGIATYTGFLTPALAQDLMSCPGPVDLVTANNVFAHAEDLRTFAISVRNMLADRGSFVFEVSYFRDVVEKKLFDTIYHEHTSYHMLRPLRDFFFGIGMRLVDAQRVNTHGGSIRCRAVKNTKGCEGDSRVLKDLLMGEPHPSKLMFNQFEEEINKAASDFSKRLGMIKQDGKNVGAYGAPAKMTTLTHQFGIDRDQIDFVVDDSTWKQGLYAPGTGIPVVSIDIFKEKNPDYCVIFAWNFSTQIIEKNLWYLEKGGTFIVPLPEYREISLKSLRGE